MDEKRLLECKDCKSTTYVIDVDTSEIVCAICGTVCGKKITSIEL